MFPEQQISQTCKDSLNVAIEQKLLEFTPYSFCSFYNDFRILQLYGEESKEYFFGNYFNGEYCGHIYTGDKFTQIEVAKACELYMPKNLKDIKDYIIEFGDKVWYYLFPSEQYAFVYNRILTKV